MIQRYVEQLVGDLREAGWRVPPPSDFWVRSRADPTNDLELEDMTFVEEFLEGDPKPISEITGIGQEQFPPAENLSPDQQALLAVEMENLLELFHFKLNFPAGFPANLRYPFFRNFWAEEHCSVSFGTIDIFFCEFEEEYCPFPGYCQTCKHMKTQMIFDEEEAARYGFSEDEAKKNLPEQPIL